MPKPTNRDLHGIVSAAMLPAAERLGSAVRTLSELFGEWEAEDETERERGRNALADIGRLARAIIDVPGEPGPLTEGAVNAAIRLLERGRDALALIETYGLRHKSDCTFFWGNSCSCGLAPALYALLSGEPGQGNAEASERNGDAACDAAAQTILGQTAAAGNQWIGGKPGFAGGLGYATQPKHVTSSVASPEVRALDSAMWEFADQEQVEQFNREQRIRREACEAALPQPAPRERAQIAAVRYPLKRRVPAPPIDDPHGQGFWRIEASGKVSYSSASNRSNLMPWSLNYPTLTPARVRALYALLESPWVWEDDTEPEEAT